MESSRLALLNQNGFVIVHGLLTPSELIELRSACDETSKLARAGSWRTVRSLPKQFPPWVVQPGANPAAQGIWGVQNLMNPALPEHVAFTKNYFSNAIVEITRNLLQCTDEDLVMELFNLLVRPDRDFELRWHRDDIHADASAEEEVKRLKEPAWHAQWNLCLYDDDSLIVVPGSHQRARTDAERNAGPFEKYLEGQLVVKLKAGDGVFYNNNILHRGVYNSKNERMTLHGSIGHIKGGGLRATNVLQHGIKDWIEKCDFSCLGAEERPRAEGMRRRLMNLAKSSGEVGYSLNE